MNIQHLFENIVLEVLLENLLLHEVQSEDE
jgi:hypothetical protein